MTKPEAVADLIREARIERNTRTGAKRTIRACKALGFTLAETIAVLDSFNYADTGGAVAHTTPWRDVIVDMQKRGKP